MIERPASSQKIERNEEEFRLLREELARSLEMVEEHRFDHLVRLTDYAASVIGNTNLATDINTDGPMSKETPPRASSRLSVGRRRSPGK